MSKYLGDFAEDATLRFKFTTQDASGGAIAPSTAFEAADLVIYKDDSATKKTSVNGITMTSPFDSITGLHNVTIDTSNDTSDAGFWVSGADYSVVLSPDETVDGQTIIAVVAEFSIENRHNTVVLGNVSHGGAAATLTLENMTVVSTTTNTAAIIATGNGTGAGIQATGGADPASTNSGPGVEITGGANTQIGFNGGSGLQVAGGAASGAAASSGGIGIDIDGGTSTASNTGHGIDIAGFITLNLSPEINGIFINGGTGSAISLSCASTSETVLITNTSTGDGLDIQGGSSGGNAITLEARGGDGHGIKIDGDGAGVGARITAGDTGRAIRLLGGVTGGGGEVVEILARGGDDNAITLTADGTGKALDVTVGDYLGLQYLFNVDYDPASKPGVATALLNELIGDDGGVSQFTTNTLELGPLGNNLSTGDIDARLVAIGLDHLVSVAVVGADITDNSIIAMLVSKSATADWDSFVNTTDSLEAVADGSVAPTAAANAIAVWDALQASHVTAGSFGIIASEISTLLTNVPDVISLAAVNAEVDTALSDIGLDHLLSVAVTGADVADDSIISSIVSKSATADWDDFVNTTDSLQAISDTSSPSAAVIADTVWDEAISGHVGAGSFGEEVQAHALSSEITALNDISTTEVNTEVDTALADINLDHFMKVAVIGADVVDNSALAKLVSKAATADWDDFVNTTDSLEAISDSSGGDATGANQTTIITHLTDIKGSGWSSATDALEEIRDAIDTISSSSGSGADLVTLTITQESTGKAIADADVWISSDAGGGTVVAGTLQTTSNGKATFMLDAGSTYYLWVQKDGIVSIQGKSFVAVAD